MLALMPDQVRDFLCAPISRRLKRPNFPTDPADVPVLP